MSSRHPHATRAGLGAERHNEVRPSPAATGGPLLPSFTPLPDARSALRTGAVSPADVLAACRDRIEQSEAELGAWRAWDPGAAEAEANRMDATRRDGLPLWGIPLGIKEIID